MVIGSKSLMKMTIVEKLFFMKVKMEFILNIKTAIKNQLLEICVGMSDVFKINDQFFMIFSAENTGST